MYSYPNLKGAKIINHNEQRKYQETLTKSKINKTKIKRKKEKKINKKEYKRKKTFK